jgi:phosphoribosylformimino-5-aminoimidazole carboxamide ribonucleotide (ProFAR) isomerase
VPFTLLPALDLTDGRLGVWSPDGPHPIEAFEGDPMAAARAFLDTGARWLHVVDMDLAFTGEPSNLSLLRRIASLPGARVQASGGIRDLEAARAFYEAGAQRVVVASAALTSESTVTELIQRARPDALSFGLEIEGGRIRGRGRDRVDLDLIETLGWLRAVGATALLVTAVTRVGTTTGPDTEIVRRVARWGVPTIAAGGIRSIADLGSVRAVGAVGAVVGRAALEGDLKLADAIAWSASPAGLLE